MKNLPTTITLVLTLGCSTYSADELNGKWAIEGEPFELWILDTLAIGFDFEYQLMHLYKVDYDDKMLTFTSIEPYRGSTWEDKVITVIQDKMELELQNPGNRKKRKYVKLTSELPVISSDYETNFQQYESYMINKMSIR
ncbi:MULTISPECIES: hypothetical protein [unclassified Imperialibacter]|uniref:hypothetical protein n=1 Tax=unclassified Imperialibacter TaxID=2629706 RepID=UPI00125F5CD8|nr:MULTISPECIES: hypothetical protein [unclassified Imperialibacter]